MGWVLKNKLYIYLALVFIFGLALRILSIWPSNIIFGFDQARDFFDARTIFFDRNLRFIGPTAGNNPSLHHGVLYLYYILPPLLVGRGNPAIVAVWNSVFNTTTAVVLFFLARSLFKSTKAGIISSIVTAASFYYIQFSGWLSNPTGTLFTVPLCFLGIWLYKGGKKWGLLLASFFLGATIQFELFFIYLIPTFMILWVILKLKISSVKLFFSSLALFIMATSTMILTEIKFGFAGIKSVLFAGGLVGGTKMDFSGILINFIQNRWETFYLNIWPQNREVGTLIGIIATAIIIIETVKNWRSKEIFQRNLFILIWFFSPAIMFVLGQHNAPWFYVGRPAAGILIFTNLITKIKSKYLVSLVLALVLISNLVTVKNNLGVGQVLLEPDKSALLSTQLSVIDYTYQKSNKESFAIDTVTNPLYINAVWGYNYQWYGLKKYGFLPDWLGGIQVHPYDNLPKSKSIDKYSYVIIDDTPRIPPVYKTNAVKSAEKVGVLIEEVNQGGIKILTYKDKGFK
ncbi:hypothetical protein HY045_01105 [Candidatus Woesebacteria bacterium]|nr:hypothetical protein [Candidatus Woesebacteria bacterium]